jgi:hypothetical protein
VGDNRIPLGRQDSVKRPTEGRYINMRREREDTETRVGINEGLKGMQQPALVETSVDDDDDMWTVQI